jgi:oxaloacetate decarboxylase alpha subunit
MASGLEAARGGAELIACAVYPVALTVYRVSGEAMASALAGLGLDPGVDVGALWRASDVVDEHIGDEPVTPLAPRIAVRAAEHRVPPGLVAALDSHLRALAAGDRVDEVLQELARIREEVGWPPLAAPIGQILGSQALLHVLSAARYQTVVDELRALLEGRYGSPPGPIDPAVLRAVALVSDGSPKEELPAELDSIKAEAEGLASSEEELLLLALFGEEAEPLLQSIRSRAGGDESLAAGGVDQARAERIREIVRIVQESGVGEVTIEESGMRVSVRRTPEQLEPQLAAAAQQSAGEAEAAAPEPGPEADGVVRVEAPMVGVFYRAPQPGAPPFVEEGELVTAGQTLCILEAMKLMNEIKADTPGVIRSINVGNAEPVEFGQLLFELEPLAPQPLDAV